MRDSFVFYSSFADSIETAPEEMQLELYKALVECGLERKAIADISFPASLFVTQAMASISNAQKRHEQAVENGGKGGRPRKWVDREEAEQLYAELKSWDKVADKLGVARETLRKARTVWDAQKPKNLNNNININDNDNVNINDNEKILKDFSQLSLSKNLNNPSDETDGTQLEAVPPPPGWEWKGGVLEDDGHHFRLAINKTTREGRGIQLD